MRVFEGVPGKYLLPLAAVFGTVVGLGSLPAAAASQPRSVEVITDAGGTAAACPFHVFARGFHQGQELRFTVHHHPSDGEVVLESSFGIGANGHGRSPAGGEWDLPNGVYELHLLASPPGKTPPDPDEYEGGFEQDGGSGPGRHAEGSTHGAQAVTVAGVATAASAANVSEVDAHEENARTATWYHERFTRVFELTCEEAAQEPPPVPEPPEKPSQAGEQAQPVDHEIPSSPEPSPEPAPEQHQPELPRTGVSVAKLLAGGLGLLLIGAFLVAATAYRRTP